jgi:hypothetical protein
MLEGLMFVAATAIVSAPVPAPLQNRAIVGTVRDAHTGLPIARALVAQLNTVTSAFSDTNGQFRLPLDPNGAHMLSISSAGYDEARVSFESAGTLGIKLVPVSLPGLATPVTVRSKEALASVPLEPPEGPLPSELWLSYRLDFAMAAVDQATLGGLANNHNAAGGRFRWQNWLLELEGSHGQMPVNVAELAAQDNPAFAPSTWQAAATVSRVWAPRPDTEASVGLGYRWIDTVANNKGIPYTSSAFDFEQSRQALGVMGQMGWHPPGRWWLEGGLGAYPVFSAWAQAPGETMASTFVADARVEALYECVPGLRLGLGYELETLQGNGSDTSHLFGIRLHYRPAGLP